MRHLVPENRARAYDVRRVLEHLADAGSVLELRRAWATGMVTALARVEGRPLGVIANDPADTRARIPEALRIPPPPRPRDAKKRPRVDTW